VIEQYTDSAPMHTVALCVINLFAGTDMVRLITSNTNACNGVVRAVACVVQEIVLNKSCEIPLPGLPMT